MKFRTLISHIVHVVSMEQVPIIEGSVSFQSKLVSGAQYSGEHNHHKVNITGLLELEMLLAHLHACCYLVPLAFPFCCFH
jgi:hypothetical protein